MRGHSCLVVKLHISHENTVSPCSLFYVLDTFDSVLNSAFWEVKTGTINPTAYYFLMLSLLTMIFAILVIIRDGLGEVRTFYLDQRVDDDYTNTSK